MNSQNELAKNTKDWRNELMIAYRGPTLIAEPDLRWPILILAAALTALLAIATAGLYYVAATQSAVTSYTEPRLEGALQPGQPAFEEFRRHIAIEQLVGTEKVHPFDTLAVAMTATLHNNTGRNISGLELRGGAGPDKRERARTDGSDRAAATKVTRVG
jgi:hypothetical protein